METLESRAMLSGLAGNAITVTANDDYYTVDPAGRINTSYSRGGHLMENDDPSSRRDYRDVVRRAELTTSPSHGQITRFGPNGGFTYIPNDYSQGFPEGFTEPIRSPIRSARSTGRVPIQRQPRFSSGTSDHTISNCRAVPLTKMNQPAPLLGSWKLSMWTTTVVIRSSWCVGTIGSKSLVTNCELPER